MLSINYIYNDYINYIYKLYIYINYTVHIDWQNRERGLV